MKTMKTSSVKGIAKKAITLGVTALLLASCGKDKNKVDENAVANPFGFPAGTIQNCNSPVQRVFDFNQGNLSPAGARGGAVYATYIGNDPTTNDSAMIRDYGNNSMQLIVNICRTGDTNIDNILLNSVPTITQTFTGDLNVPNKAACPGRINTGTLNFGYVQSQYGAVPVMSSFQPPQVCL